MSSLAAAMFSFRPMSAVVSTHNNKDHNKIDNNDANHNVDNNNNNDDDNHHNYHHHHHHHNNTITTTPTNPTQSLLVYMTGMSNIDYWQKWYLGCCSASFYCGMCATGLSAVLNAWLAATPPGGIAVFVKRHSKFLATVPALLGISTALSGTALFVGLDMLSLGAPAPNEDNQLEEDDHDIHHHHYHHHHHHNNNNNNNNNSHHDHHDDDHHHGFAILSYVGLVGTTVCCGLVGVAAIRGWVTTYQLLHNPSRFVRVSNRGRHHRRHHRRHH
jgi:hypothetical protein